MNKVSIIGDMVKNPRWGIQPNGEPACVLCVATSENDSRHCSNRGEIELHRILLAGDLAVSLRNTVRKGDSVEIEGRIRTKRWKDDSGKDRSIMEIVGYAIKVVSKNRSDTASADSECETNAEWAADYDAAWARERAMNDALEAARMARMKSRRPQSIPLANQLSKMESSSSVVRMRRSPGDAGVVRNRYQYAQSASTKTSRAVLPHALAA